MIFFSCSLFSVAFADQIRWRTRPSTRLGTFTGLQWNRNACHCSGWRGKKRRADVKVPVRSGRPEVDRFHRLGQPVSQREALRQRRTLRGARYGRGKRTMESPSNHQVAVPRLRVLLRRTIHRRHSPTAASVIGALWCIDCRPPSQFDEESTIFVDCHASWFDIGSTKGRCVQRSLQSDYCFARVGPRLHC